MKISFWKIGLGLVLIITVVIQFQSWRSKSNRLSNCLEKCQRDLNISFNGIIIKVNREPYINNSTILVLSDLDTTQSSLFLELDFLQVGDSLKKYKGEFKYDVFRDNRLYKTVTVGSTNCELWCK